MKAKITDGMMDAMRQIALGESMHKDDEIKEAEHEEIEEAEEELEEKSNIPAKGKGGRITGATARAAGALTGMGAGATAGSIVPVVGTAVGGALGAVGGYKIGRDAHRALYKESLDEATLAAIVEAVTPMADRIDALNEAFDSDILNEAELDAGIAQALAEAAIAGFALSEMSHKDEDLEEMDGAAEGMRAVFGDEVPELPVAESEDDLEEAEDDLEEADGKKGSALGTAAKLAGTAAAVGGLGYAASKGMLGDTAKNVASAAADKAKGVGSTISGIMGGNKALPKGAEMVAGLTKNT